MAQRTTTGATAAHMSGNRSPLRCHPLLDWLKQMCCNGSRRDRLAVNGRDHARWLLNRKAAGAGIADCFTDTSPVRYGRPSTSRRVRTGPQHAGPSALPGPITHGYNDRGHAPVVVDSTTRSAATSVRCRRHLDPDGLRSLRSLTREREPYRHEGGRRPLRGSAWRDRAHHPLEPLQGHPFRMLLRRWWARGRGHCPASSRLVPAGVEPVSATESAGYPCVVRLFRKKLANVSNGMRSTRS